MDITVLFRHSCGHVPKICTCQRQYTHCVLQVGAPAGCACAEGEVGIAVARPSQGFGGPDSTAGSDIIGRAVGRGEV